jgi:hypothetical protein
MKLIRLRSIANNAVRDSIWNPELIGIEPFSIIRPQKTIFVDLIKGTLNPDMKGDAVEKFYLGMSKWFHQALEKEKIPITVIESAVITITPEGKQCTIIAEGKTFKSHLKSF